MAQVFPRQANTVVTLSFAGLALALVLAFGAWWWFTRSDYVRWVGEEITQPVPFQHALHVGGLKMQCQYCHNGVGESAYANVPATETCMSCHSQVRTDSAKLAPIRNSWTENTSMQWEKVHKFPEYVYFNHSVHVSKGVGCSSCHGNIGAMNVVYKAEPMYMQWCLNCHRNPEQFVRPKDQIYNTAYEYPENQAELGARLVQEYGIKKDNLTNCSICHR